MAGLYKGIIADPPWSYGSPRAMVGNGGRGAAGAKRIIQVDADAQYPTMSLDEIKALQINAASSCLLFMWATGPFLASGAASEVVKAWGFRPINVVTWVKVQNDGVTPSRKNGWWFRSASEHLIIADKGKVPRPASWPALATWFPHRRMPHSVKPDLMHEIMQKAVPEGPYLEMFARREYPGWDVWGNQVGGLQ